MIALYHPVPNISRLLSFYHPGPCGLLQLDYTTRYDDSNKVYNREIGEALQAPRFLFAS